MARTKTTPPPQPAAEPSPPQPARRGDRGLTTLEWLLIVAAVAGLAALAVVLVQNVVDETAEQISGSSARITAARVATQQINSSSDKPADKQSACERLRITYGDAMDSADTKKKVMWYLPSSTKTGQKYDGVALDPPPTDNSCHIVDA